MSKDREALMLINEKRQRNRVTFETRVNVKSSDETFLSEGTSKNIGMGGIYIEMPDFLGPQTPCDVEIVLNARHSHIVLHIKGNVSRIDEKGMAVKFEKDLEWWALFAIYGQYGNPAAKLFAA